MKPHRFPCDDPDCGYCESRAEDRALDAEPDFDESAAGYAYSVDPARYSPACVPCHKRSDLARIAS